MSATSQKAAALAALKRAKEEATRPDGVNLMVLGYLIEDAVKKTEAITEGRPGRRKATTQPSDAQGEST